MTKRHKATVVILAIGLLLFLIHAVRSALVSVPASLIKVEEPSSFSSASYEALLKKFVQDYCVDYQELAHSEELQQAIGELKTISPANFADDKERLAFWINAYNLLVLRSICDKYPIGSVKELGNSFNASEYVVGGKTYTLEDIYGMQVCPLTKKINPMAIFLVCRGATGYPPLQDHPIEKSTLDSDADQAASRFINDPKNVYYDAASNSINISPFFEWCKFVFSGRFDNPYVLVEQYLKKKTINNKTVKSMTLPFDWTLNDKRFLQ